MKCNIHEIQYSFYIPWLDDFSFSFQYKIMIYSVNACSSIWFPSKYNSNTRDRRGLYVNKCSKNEMGKRYIDESLLINEYTLALLRLFCNWLPLVNLRKALKVMCQILLKLIRSLTIHDQYKNLRWLQTHDRISVFQYFWCVKRKKISK